MSTVNNLFSTEEESQNLFAGARQLEGTAQLTSIASRIAEDILKRVDADFENYKDSIEQSKNDHNAMDKLIESVIDLTEVDTEFIKALSDETIDGILKSQQSKRSRCKSQLMSLKNYTSMLTAAVAENLVRKATGKTKNSFSHRSDSIMEMTDEQIEYLTNNQEELRKAIRNIQSRKSIMKSKADFSTEDERWIALNKVEATLKDLRVTTRDNTRQAIADLLGTTDIEELHAKDSKELLEAIKNIINN